MADSPAAKCRGVDLRPAVSRALTVFGLTNAFTLARSPVLQASKSSRSGSPPPLPPPPPPPPPDPGSESAAFDSVDLRPAISSHRHFHAVAPSDDGPRDAVATDMQAHLTSEASETSGCMHATTETDGRAREDRRTDGRTDVQGKRGGERTNGLLGKQLAHSSDVPRFRTATVDEVLTQDLRP